MASVPTGTSAGPGPEEIDRLAGLFSANRHAEVEAGARQMVSAWPGSAFGWKALGSALSAQMRFEEALPFLQKSLALVPTDPEAHINLANTLRELGRLSEAEAGYRRALELKPDTPSAHNNLGTIVHTRGRPAEAEASYRRALALLPDYAVAHQNLGNALRDLARLPEAEACYRRTIELTPDNHEAHNNLGNALRELGRLSEAQGSYRRSLELKPDFTSAHCNLGSTLQALGRLSEAEASFRRALETSPADGSRDGQLVNAQVLHSRILAHIVPEWHVPMINDSLRNGAYQEALRAAVTPHSKVLEIGTGSGLLAMMAAQLGAARVTTCEAVPLIAATARDIVALNGYASSIRVIPKRSNELAVGVDLPERADLLVSEIFSSELLGEGVLPSIEDAKRRLLAPGARIIPATASIVFALFGGDETGQNILVDKVCGFDLGKFNAIASQRRYVHRRDLDIALLTADTEAFSFDFVKQDYFPVGRKTLRLPITAAGRCHGVVQWIRLGMDERIVFENHPSARTPASGWQHCLYRFPAPVDVAPGQTAIIRAAHDRNAVWFFYEGLASGSRRP